jgi:hypothetical protein
MRDSRQRCFFGVNFSVLDVIVGILHAVLGTQEISVRRRTLKTCPPKVALKIPSHTKDIWTLWAFTSLLQRLPAPQKEGSEKPLNMLQLRTRLAFVFNTFFS